MKAADYVQMWQPGAVVAAPHSVGLQQMWRYGSQHTWYLLPAAAAVHMATRRAAHVAVLLLQPHCWLPRNARWYGLRQCLRRRVHYLV